MKKDTRESIISLSLEEIALNGISGFSLKRVAEKSGIKPSSVYAFFKSKDDLIRESIETAASSFRAYNIKLDLKNRAENLIETLFTYYIDEFEDKTLQNFYRILQKEALSNKYVYSLYQSFTYTIETQIRFILDEKLGLKEDDEETDKRLSLLTMVLKDSLMSVLFQEIVEGKESAVWLSKKVSTLISPMLLN